MDILTDIRLDRRLFKVTGTGRTYYIYFVEQRVLLIDRGIAYHPVIWDCGDLTYLDYKDGVELFLKTGKDGNYIYHEISIATLLTHPKSEVRAWAKETIGIT